MKRPADIKCRKFKVCTILGYMISHSKKLFNICLLYISVKSMISSQQYITTVKTCITLIVTTVIRLGTTTSFVGNECTNYHECNSPVEILQTFKESPDNYQQLLNAFYPINQARPSSVIIAYFTNYTDSFPDECSGETYPWKTYPRINYKYHNISWYMWTKMQSLSIGDPTSMIQFSLYLPLQSYHFITKKSTMLFLPTQTACLKIPFTVGNTSHLKNGYALLGDVTAQVN